MTHPHLYEMPLPDHEAIDVSAWLERWEEGYHDPDMISWEIGCAVPAADLSPMRLPYSARTPLEVQRRRAEWAIRMVRVEAQALALSHPGRRLTVAEIQRHWAGVRERILGQLTRWEEEIG